LNRFGVSRYDFPVNHRAVIIGIAGVVLSAAMAPRAGATILLFDQQRDAVSQTVVSPTTSGGTVPLDYGDHVSSSLMEVTGGFFTYGDGGEGFTPNVTVDLYTDDGTPTNPRARLWQTNYGDLVNVVFGEGAGIGGSSALNVLFSAEAGYEVDLYGFDLAGWSDADYTIAAVEVFAGEALLFSAPDVLVQGDFVGPRHTSFAFAEPLSGQELLLRLDLSNLAQSIQDNIGIDSIRFGQTPPGAVPEPGVSTGVALFAAAMLTARRSLRLR
jgi:hypothetical protein